MRVISLLLPALLGGCQVDASALDQEVNTNLTKQDYRLIVRAGRGEVAPGIPAEQQAQAKARCGVRYLDGLGDLIRPGEEETHAKLYAFASEFNQRMVVHCPAALGMGK